MKIVWLSTAETDVASLVDYISQDNPKIALNIFNTIIHAIEKLSSYPHAGREGRVEQTRELVIPSLPFIVVYRIGLDIEILAILHTSQKWPKA